MSRSFLLCLGAAALLAGGCADGDDVTGTPLPEDDYELPERSSSVDPADLVVGRYIATPCELHRPGGFDDLRQRDEWATVDVHFGRDSEAGPWDRPSGADEALVEAHGGRVLHRFAVPAVRARMVLSRIPDLVADGFWITVRDVPDPTRYDLEVIVGYTRPVTDADVQRFRSLGGRVETRYTTVPGLFGVLPDASVAVLRARPEVKWVEPNGVACIG